jgi:uncharacterized membrane protein YhaH (DUF805 family)
MITTYFGEIRNGRLLRLPYLGYSLLLQLLTFAVFMGIAFAIGVGEHLVGGDLEQAQMILQEKFSLPLLLLCAVLGALFAFANFNIMAKRIRDTGLPGWWGVGALMVIGIALSALLSEELGSSFHTLSWVILLLIPSNSFSGNKN